MDARRRHGSTRDDGGWIDGRDTGARDADRSVDGETDGRGTHRPGRADRPRRRGERRTLMSGPA
jgi:hypothetical protein